MSRAASSAAMAAAADYARSPFDVFNFVPQGHEKALKQALYNTVALLFVAFVFIAGVAVYFVLEPFLSPLLWAVLFGSVLHPFKRSLSELLKSWLHGLHETGTLFAVGVVILPFQVMDNVSENACNVILKYLKLFVAVSATIPTFYLVYNFLPMSVVWKLYDGLWDMYHFLSAVLEIFTANLLVWTVLIGYCLLLCFWWNSQTKSVLTRLSPLVWSAFFCHLATIAGAWRVPILVFIVALLMMGFIAELKGQRCDRDSEVEILECPSPAIMTIKAGWTWLTGSGSGTPMESVPQFPQGSSTEGKPTATQRVQVEPSTPEHSHTKPATTPPTKEKISKIKPEPKEDNQKLSNLYLYGLLWACILAQLWCHMWLLHLLYIPLVYTVMKRLGSHFNIFAYLMEKFQALSENLLKWYEDRKDALIPAPVRGLWKLLIEGDQRLISLLETSIDTFTTVGCIMLVFILAVVGTVFLAVQVYGESMHLVEVTSSLINRTVVHNPELQQLLPETLHNIQNALDSMLGDAYLYGREWIITTLRRVIDEKDEARAAATERQILELWDRVYQLWVARNTSVHPHVAHHTLHRTQSWDNLLDGLKTLDFSLLMNFVKENIGTFMSVLDSLWAVLKGNISVALSVLTATLSLLFGGGTAVLNFVLNFIVFSTALFYLLCASGERYKPVELFSRFIPSHETATKLGEAVEEAVSGVFAASFKMAAFYGLYTWLIHTLFDVKIVYIPSVLAALFGAVPFLGAYWACLPAVMELWLVNGHLLKAILMMMCQLMPTSFVDSAIYSEIRGGGHPFLTGLAIAGGMFCLGFEGALFGPMLLCVLIVAMNMYGGMMTEEHPSAGVPRSARFSLKRMFTID